MRISASSVTCLCAGGVLALGMPSAARTQGAPNGTISVAGELGPRAYPSRMDTLAIGKFEEYRDMRARANTSLLLEQLLLQYTPADSFGIYTLSARRLFDRDQSVWLMATRPGQYDFQFRWDRIPHTHSTTARSPGDELANPGFNTLPAVRPDSFAWRNAPYIGPIRSQWDPIEASLGLTPNEKLDFRAEYTRIAKKGGTPRSISFRGSGGPQREFVSPIDQTVSNVRLSQGYTSGTSRSGDPSSFIKSFQVNLAYEYSSFRNGLAATMVDSPLRSVSSPTDGSSVARVSLEPSNSAQTAAVTGAVLLPWRTRVTGSLNRSWSRQNDPFLPQTSNDSLSSDPNFSLVSTLMRSSLDGQARTSAYNLALTTHPMDKLTVSARIRSFDYSNQTPAFQIRAMVISDRSIALGDSLHFERFPYTKANSDLSASYQLARGLSLSAGHAWENWTRDPEVRNIARTFEETPYATLNYTSLDWLSVRWSYRASSRRGRGEYTLHTAEFTDYRRFDVADRNRKRMTLITSVMPTDAVSIGLTYQTGNDKFPHSVYGVQSDKSTAFGLDADWSPSERFSAGAGWIRENVKDSANYRYRTGAVGSVTYDNPSYRWMNTNKDRNTTWFASLGAVLVPDKLDLAAHWSVTDSHWWMFNVNPMVPTGGTAAQNLNATAQDWPEVSQRIEPLTLALRYLYSADWAMTLRFQSEKYSQTDFRTVAPVFTTNSLNDGPLLPVGFLPGDLPGTIGQVSGSNTGQYHFLGNNYHPYSVNWLTLTITYNPSAIPFRRGRSTL